MATTSTYNIRIDKDVKSECEKLYGSLGLSLSSAINVFLRKSLYVGGFPFDVRYEVPNEETRAAMDNILAGQNLSRSFSSVSELMEDLDADDSV